MDLDPLTCRGGDSDPGSAQIVGGTHYPGGGDEKVIPAEILISLLALYIAIGGQYFVLFKIYQQNNALQTEFAACPYHRTGRKPMEVSDDE